MARSQAASANEYANNLAPVEHALHEGFVGVAGIVGYSAGPIGSALAAGAIDSEITSLEGNDAKTSLLSGAKTAAFGLVLGKAGEIVSGPVSRYLASEAFGSVAPTFARAVSYFSRKGTNCFVAGTPVQMADGTTKPIEQVKAGDFVKSRNPQTGQTEAKRVTETFSHLAPQVLTLSLTDPQTGHAAEQITCTPGHPFYVDGKGFVLAGQLGIGTSIVTRAGPSLTLSATSWSAAPASGNGLMLDSNNTDGSTATPGTRVYNFTVDGDHTYFVGTVGGGTWVHNDSIKVVPGGEGSDLAQLADEYRGLNGLGNRGGQRPWPERTPNLAVFEHEEIIGGVSYRQKTLFISSSERHAEEAGLEHFAGREHQITRVYSEFHPCDPRRKNCWGQLKSKLPTNAKIYYSDPYMGLGR